MRKRTIPPIQKAQKDDELIVTLPAEALEALGVPISGHEAGRSDRYMSASPAGRNEPFPCFKKAIWDDRPTIKIIQTPAGGMA
jgi:hypothetical protein